MNTLENEHRQEKNRRVWTIIAGCQSYTNYLTKLAVYGSDAEILTAILVVFPVWDANCDKMSSALKKNYGFTNTSCAFLDNFAAPLPREFVEKSNDIVRPALKTKEKEMQIAARLLLGYELSSEIQLIITLLFMTEKNLFVWSV